MCSCQCSESCEGAESCSHMHEPMSVKPSRLPWVFRPIRNWLSIASADAIIVVAQSYAEFLHAFLSACDGSRAS